MKRILCLIDHLGAGGAQRQMVGLSVLLKEKGYDVSVAVYHDIPFFANYLHENGVPIKYLDKAHNKSTRIIYIARYIRESKPDYVISYLDTPNICSCLAKILNNSFKLIVSERNTTQKTGIKEKIKFNLFRFADYIVPNSHTQAQYITSTCPYLKNKIKTISNFVDTNYFVPNTQCLPKSNNDVIIVGSIWPQKNTLAFIDAVAEMKRKGLNIRFDWYGKCNFEPGYVEKCQAKIRELQLTGMIELKDKSPHIKEHYLKAKFFCLPSLYEGTPNVICEAMSCGLPILCSDVCDNSRYVRNGENGFLFNPKDTSSIVAAFERMLVLPKEKYISFSRRSRELAEQLCSTEHFVNEYIKLLEKCQ